MVYVLRKAMILACVSILSLLGRRRLEKDLGTATLQGLEKELPVRTATAESTKLNTIPMQETDAASTASQNSDSLKKTPAPPLKGTYTISNRGRNRCPWGWEKVTTEQICIHAAMKLLLSGLTDGYIGPVPFYAGDVSSPHYPGGCYYGKDHRTLVDGAVSFNEHWRGKAHPHYSVICQASAYKLMERNTNDCRLDFRWHNVSTINDCYQAAIWLGLPDKFPAEVQLSELPSGCSFGETGLSFNSDIGSMQNQSAVICQARQSYPRDDKRKKTAEQALAQPPCDTMFIGNLASGVREAELHQVLSGFSGYVRLKMSGQRYQPTAFALFDSVHSCTEALKQLYGMALPGSPQKALNCEFASNSLGKRTRD